MATIIGRSKKVAISADGITYTDIGKIIEASMDWETCLADETTDSSNGYREEKQADTQLTLTFSGKLDSSDAGQVLMIAAAIAKTPYYLRYRPQETTGEIQYIAQFNISTKGLSGSTSEVQEFSATAKSTGTITKSVQT